MASSRDLERRLQAVGPTIINPREAALIGRLAVSSCLVVDIPKAETMFGESFRAFWEAYAKYDCSLAGVSLTTMDHAAFRKSGTYQVARKDLFAKALEMYLVHRIEEGKVSSEELISLGKYVARLDDSFAEPVVRIVGEYADSTPGKPLLAEEVMIAQEERSRRYERMRTKYDGAWNSGVNYEALRQRVAPDSPCLYRKKEVDNRQAMQMALGELTEKSGSELVAFEQRVYTAMNAIVHWEYHALAMALKTL